MHSLLCSQWVRSHIYAIHLTVLSLQRLKEHFRPIQVIEQTRVLFYSYFSDRREGIIQLDLLKKRLFA